MADPEVDLAIDPANTGTWTEHITWAVFRKNETPMAELEVDLDVDLRELAVLHATTNGRDGLRQMEAVQIQTLRETQRLVDTLNSNVSKLEKKTGEILAALRPGTEEEPRLRLSYRVRSSRSQRA